MRVGIDCRLSGPRHAGIGRYIENLISRLPTLAPEIEWHYFFHDQDQVGTWTPAPNVSLHLVPIDHYSLAEQVTLSGIFAQQFFGTRTISA